VVVALSVLRTGSLTVAQYRFSAAVFSRDIAATANLKEQVNAGQPSFNLPTSGSEVQQTFGGFYGSRSAFKGHGLEALRSYTDQTVTVESA
jgi:acyl-CoA reductase-like NAD-dependent aldehyde dehydrogenase